MALEEHRRGDRKEWKERGEREMEIKGQGLISEIIGGYKKLRKMKWEGKGKILS